MNVVFRLKSTPTLKLRYLPGIVGPSGTVELGTVTTGAPGTNVIITNTGTPQDAVLNFTIPRGDKGETGDKGWSPILAIVTDGARRVVQVSDWTGGQGTKPASGSYIGPSGLVSDIALAVDIRGATGATGPAVADGDKGDVVVSSSGTVWTVDANAIDNTKLRQGAALTVIGRSANSTGNVADIAAGTDGYVLRRSGTSLGFGTVANAGLADMAQNTIKGRVTASTGAPEDLTATQARSVISAVARSTSATPIAMTSGTAQEWTGLPTGITSAVIYFRGISTTGNSTIGVRIGPSGGAVSSGYSGTATQIISGTSPTTGAITSILPVILSPAASTVDGGSMRLTLIDAATNLWSAEGLFGTTTGVQLITSGDVALAGALARIQITTVGGTDTFDLGTAYLSYTAP